MEETEFKHERLLSKLTNKQTAVFMWIAILRATPFHAKRFQTPSDSRFLALLFLSLETSRALYSFSSFKLELPFDIARTLIRILAPKRAFDRTLALALDFILDLSQDFGIDNDRNNRAIFFVNTLALDTDKERCNKYIDLMWEDVQLLYENKDNKLNIDISWYGDAWEEWLKALQNLGGGYWADWYVRQFKNRFRITDREEIKRHLSLPEELWSQDLRVSSQWLMKLSKLGAKYLNEARIILLGEKGAGKTSLARRIVNPNASMPTKDESTDGVEVTNVKLSEMLPKIPQNRDANVHIWDFAGHTITHAAHRFFLSERCLYIIVYDGRTEERNRLAYWLDHVRNYGGRSRALVLVNLQDNHSPDIAETYFKERYADNLCEFISFSVQDNKEQLQHFREKLATLIAADPAWDQKIPVDYHGVKEHIENAFTKEHRNHITREEFDEIANSVEMGERGGLLESLTCLGVCLWYPNIQGIDLLVLNPEWITRGIYRVINWLRESGRGDASIKLSEFGSVFEAIESDYPKDKHKFLYELMQNYELAYKKAYHDEIVVPQCLPEDCPAKEHLPKFPQESSLYVEITANKSGSDGPRLTFPPDVLPRFIVRRSEDLRDCSIWRYGTELKRGDVTALIEQEEYLIRLRVKGNERRDYLGELLYTLIVVLNDYPGFAAEKPEVNCCIVGSDGSFEMIPIIQINNLVRHMEKENIASYYDFAREFNIPLENAKMYLSPMINFYFVSAAQANIAPKGLLTATQKN